MTILTPANISWQDAQPIAIDYDDIYYSKDAIAETLRVFMGPADVIATAQAQQQICVAEAGFGTALNFAVCADEILANSNSQLHFISFEKHPLRHDDWQKIVAQRRDQLPIYNELGAQPLPLLPGWHRRVLAGGRVVLSVFHGEISEGLDDLVERQRNPVDVWFLDGFAPAKNPTMWTPALFSQIAQMSRTGSTISTFTAAGHVRRGLQTVGFDMRRVDQQPFKRESLAGHFQSIGRQPQSSTPGEVVIHGAGIGGACMARHLAELGISVSVFDPQGIASGASRIDAAVLHARLLGDRSTSADLRVSAFHYASNYVQRFSGFTKTGVLQTQGPNLDAPKMKRIIDAYGADQRDQHHWIKPVANESSQSPNHPEALLFPTAGVVDLPQLCGSLLDHAKIEVIPCQADLDHHQCHIICTGTAARDVEGCDWLEIVDVHGQIDWFATDTTATIPTLGNGYLVPTERGCALGATYEHTPWPAADATAHNWQLNAHQFSAAPPHAAEHSWLRRVRAARAVASDREPVIGRIKNHEQLENLWIATAFGSMGTTAAPLAAAMISSELLGWLPPVSVGVEVLSNPIRFKQRQARRGIRHIKPRTTPAR